MLAYRIDTDFDIEHPELLDVLVGETVANAAARAVPRHVPVVATLNGKILFRKDWGHRLADNDNLVLTAVPMGEGGSDVFRSVLQIALIVTAAYFLGPAGLGLTGWQYGAAMLAANAASGYLINAILPPEQATTASYNAPEAASPTYSLTASGNQARFGATRPSLYGRMRIAPDFDAKPYTEYVGNDLYLYQLFNCGDGPQAHHRYQIEDTDWWNEDDGVTGSFPDVEYEVLAPGEPVTLFRPQVIIAPEVAAQTLFGTNEEEHETIGPFVANAAGTVTNLLGFDAVFPGGLYRISDTGKVGSADATVLYEARQIDDEGEPLGDWIELAERTYSAASRQTQRFTEKFPVAAGRWEGQTTRTDVASTDTRTVDQVQWEAMRAYLTSAASSEDCTRLAVVMKATNQLSGLSSRKVHVEATPMPDEYLGLDEAGEPQFGDPAETRHIRDACYEIVRNRSRRPGMPALSLDYEAFDALHATWAAREDYFDMVIDREMSVWEALSLALACGRAHPVWIGDKISVVRDEPRTVPKKFFSPRNIVRNSFQYMPLLRGPLSPDAVIVEYFDRRTWQWDEVYCSVLGAPEATANARRIRVPGVTTREKAWALGIYQDARDKFCREPFAFTAEMEGEFLTRLDLLDVAHPMPNWGQTAALREFDIEARTLVMSQEARWSTSEQNWLLLRRPDGTSWGPVAAAKGDTAKIAVLDADDLADVIAEQGDWEDWLDEDDGRREPPHVTIGAGEEMAVEALLIGAKGQGGHRVRLDCIVDDPRPYTAEDDFDMPAEAVKPTHPTSKEKPNLTSLSIAVSGTNYEPWVSATLKPDPNATYYEWSLSMDGVVYEFLGGGADMISWAGPMPPVEFWLRATGFGPGGQHSIIRTRDLSIVEAPPGEVTGIAIRAYFDKAAARFTLPKVDGEIEEGIKGVILAASDTSGFDPEEPGEDFVYYRRAEPAANYIEFPLDYPTVYVRIACYNFTGESDLNWSSEVEVERTEIGSGSLSETLQTAFANAETLEGGVVFKLNGEGTAIGGIALAGGDGELIEIAMQANVIQLSHPGIDGGAPFPLLTADLEGIKINYAKIKVLDAESLNALVAEIGTLYGLIYASPLGEGETLDDAKLVIDTQAPYILMRKPAP